MKSNLCHGGGGWLGPPSVPPTELWMGGTAVVQNRTNIGGKNVVCLFIDCQSNTHLNTFYMN